MFYIKAESQSGFRNGFHKVETYPRTKSHNLSVRALVFWRNSLCFGVYTLPNITVQLRRDSILAFNTSYYKHAALFTGLHCRAIWLVDVAKRIVLIWNCLNKWVMISEMRCCCWFFFPVILFHPFNSSQALFSLIIFKRRQTFLQPISSKLGNSPKWDE